MKFYSNNYLIFTLISSLINCMSQLYFNEQRVERIRSEKSKSDYLISEVLLSIKAESFLEFEEKEIINLNLNDIDNSSRIN